MSLHLPVLLAGPGPSDGAGTSRRCRGCLPPSPAFPGIRLPPASPDSCESPEAASFHRRTVQERLVALQVGDPQRVGPLGDELAVDEIRMPVGLVVGAGGTHRLT